MATLDSLFQQFLREHSGLKNVSPETRVWYETAWATFLRTQPDRACHDSDQRHRPDHPTAPERLRRGPPRPGCPSGHMQCLAAARNAYCRWLHDEGIIAEPAKLRPLKLEKRFVKTLDDPARRAILVVKPKGYPQWRVHTAVCTILDTGCRSMKCCRLRHTFATQYLKHEGDVVRLSKTLGHSEVSTTMKYLHLVTADLQGRTSVCRF